MMLNIILLVCMAPIPVILFIVMRNEARPKKNIILGVTLPKDAREDPRVLRIKNRFNLRQSVFFIIIMALTAPPFFLRSEGYAVTWYYVWILFAIVLPNLPYIAANRRLRALKRENGWYGESTGITLVDTTLAPAQKKPLSVWCFLPAALLSLAPVVHTVLTMRGHDEFVPLMIPFISLAAMTALFCFLYRIIFRQKAEVVDDNTAVNAALTRVRRYNWSKSWLLIAWLTALLDLSVWLAGFNSLVIVAEALVYSTLLVAFVMLAEFKTRRVQQKLTAESGRAVYTDDDDRWLMGMFYYNPGDSHVMVNRRTGMGMTLNMAKAPSIILVVITALMLLSIPGVGLIIVRQESAPVRLELDAGQLSAIHTKTEYIIDTSDIRSAYLLYRLPEGTKTNGTALSSVCKGSFRFDGIGGCRVCLDPRRAPYVVLETPESVYILGSGSLKETMAVYKRLQDAGIPIKDPVI